jgi:hypothetical protein
MNRLKSVMLLAILTALVLWAGQVLGGRGGFMVALGIAGGMNIGPCCLRRVRTSSASLLRALALHCQLSRQTVRASRGHASIYAIATTIKPYILNRTRITPVMSGCV